MANEGSRRIEDLSALDPSVAAGGAAGAAALDRSFFGHPRGLSTLFFTEMWERFSYYGMRAILILFMTASLADGGVAFPVEKAAAIYGLYTAFVYLMALPGGWVADNILGTRRSVLIGGVVIACGHFSMAIPTMPTFYLGLILIVLGTGLLKPNISTMVGQLYPEKGARRDAGFSIFYMGINIGALIAPFVCGFLGEKINWHLGFAAAGVGMVAGLTQYVMGARFLGDAGRYLGSAETRSHNGRVLVAGTGGILAVIALVAILQLAGLAHVTAVALADASGIIILSLALFFFLYVFSLGGLDSTEKKRVAAIAVLFIFSAIFWSGFEQAGSSLNLVAERITNRIVLGWQMPASFLQSVNPFFIICLAPVFAWLWVALGRFEPSSPAKFAFGLVLVGIGFAIMMLATSLAISGHKISPMWLVLTYFFHTLGELSLSPVGLSTVTKLAPERMVAQMMGIWFMSISFGDLIAGRVAGLFGSLPLPQIFGTVALITIGAGLFLALISRPIRKLMVGIH
jgi:proton-dependent oligopeptide transporter, POT family